MGLNLPTSDGLFARVPIIKYDSRAGRIYRVDRVETASGWQANQTEITNGFQALFDMENIDVGWLHFPVGGTPDLRMVKLGAALPDRPPGDKHRSGFRLYIKLGKEAGGDVREMASNAAVAIKGMDALVDAYIEGVKQYPGHLPLVRLASTEIVVTNGKDEIGRPVSSTNYAPKWEILKWLPRPPDLQGDYVERIKEAMKKAAQQSAQTAAPAQPAVQPAQQAQQQPAMAGGVDDDF